MLDLARQRMRAPARRPARSARGRRVRDARPCRISASRATTPGKLAELTRLLAGTAWRVLPQRDCGVTPVEETGTTFLENALAQGAQRRRGQRSAGARGRLRARGRRAGRRAGRALGALRGRARHGRRQHREAARRTAWRGPAAGARRALPLRHRARAPRATIPRRSSARACGKAASRARRAARTASATTPCSCPRARASRPPSLRPRRRIATSHRGQALRQLLPALDACCTRTHDRTRRAAARRSTCTCRGACASVRTATSTRTRCAATCRRRTYVDALIADLEQDAAAASRAARSAPCSSAAARRACSRRRRSRACSRRCTRALRLRRRLEVTLEANPGHGRARHASPTIAPPASIASRSACRASTTRASRRARPHPRRARGACRDRAGAGGRLRQLQPRPHVRRCPVRRSTRRVADVARRAARTRPRTSRTTSSRSSRARPSIAVRPRCPTTTRARPCRARPPAVLARRRLRAVRGLGVCARRGASARTTSTTGRFGDYLGIGAGAHAKLTTGATIRRTHKRRQPRAYLDVSGRRGAHRGRARSAAARSGLRVHAERAATAARLQDRGLRVAHAAARRRRSAPLLADAVNRGLLEATDGRLAADGARPAISERPAGPVPARTASRAPRSPDQALSYTQRGFALGLTEETAQPSMPSRCIPSQDLILFYF